jgi:hypothetical protein
MIKTRHQEIVDYWVSIDDECRLGVDFTEAHERCWRCGYRASLQRCHIVPDSLGGVDHPSNRVLLCGRCHREAPNHTNPKYMWVWLRATCSSLYDIYWTQRGFEEFEKMFGRKPFSELDESQASTNEAVELLRDELRNTTIHYGEGRLNPSTIACVIAEIEEKLGQKPKA